MICFGCPRHCGAERTENTPSLGFCKMPYNAVLARAALHQWEEPPISGKNGSRSEEHTSELQSLPAPDIVCRLLLEKKKK